MKLSAQLNVNGENIVIYLWFSQKGDTAPTSGMVDPANVGASDMDLKCGKKKKKKRNPCKIKRKKRKKQEGCSKRKKPKRKPCCYTPVAGDPSLPREIDVAFINRTEGPDKKEAVLLAVGERTDLGIFTGKVLFV